MYTAQYIIYVSCAYTVRFLTIYCSWRNKGDGDIFSYVLWNSSKVYCSLEQIKSLYSYIIVFVQNRIYRQSLLHWTSPRGIANILVYIRIRSILGCFTNTQPCVIISTSVFGMRETQRVYIVCTTYHCLQ